MGRCSTPKFPIFAVYRSSCEAVTYRETGVYVNLYSGKVRQGSLIVIIN